MAELQVQSIQATVLVVSIAWVWSQALDKTPRTESLRNAIREVVFGSLWLTMTMSSRGSMQNLTGYGIPLAFAHMSPPLFPKFLAQGSVPSSALQLGEVILKKLPLRSMLLGIPFQLLGFWISARTLNLLLPAVCDVAHVTPGASFFAAFLCEAVLSFGMLVVVFVLPKLLEKYKLPIALTIITVMPMLQVGLKFSGPSLNPLYALAMALAVSPHALLSPAWWMVYVVAPYAGCAVGCLVLSAVPAIGQFVHTRGPLIDRLAKQKKGT